VNPLGGEGSIPYMFFSDNTGPEIRIIYPGNDDLPTSRITVTGAVYDRVGVESLTYTYNGETRTVPLIAGNPYWP